MDKPKILICEDEKDAQQSMSHILSRRNYEVFTANDGQESIEQAGKIKPDVVMLDIRMPKIDGIEVAKEIRKFDKETKIIFVTGFQSPELLKEASKYDIVNYLVKPASSEDIVKFIELALRK
jgi:YesN/AraC family two-component response regulator